jgi:hypothetical protein
MLRRVSLVGTDVSEEISAPIIRVTRIGELGTTLMMEALSSFEGSVLTKATQRNSTEDAILRSHRRENLKSYVFLNLSSVVCQCIVVPRSLHL